MADIKEIVEDENKIDTVLSDDITLSGTLKFKNSLKIKGSFRGKIETDGHLIIGREATVTADISAHTISVSGVLNGRIKASNRIDLYKKSRTGGDLYTPDIQIESGSLFNGTCIMPDTQK